MRYLGVPFAFMQAIFAEAFAILLGRAAGDFYGDLFIVIFTVGNVLATATHARCALRKH